MTLLTLIQKNSLRQLATLTVATPATLPAITDETVAKVATVAVANPETQKTGIVEALDNSQTIEATTAPFADDLFFLDDRRHCSDCGNLIAGRCLAAWRGEIEAARHYRPVDDIPRRCAGFAPKSNDSDQRTGKQRWPNLNQLNTAQ
jgi:hypothetical protein